MEREDEVYSARQLAARDTEKKKPVKPKEPAAAVSGNLVVEPPLQTTAKLRIRVQVNSNSNNNNNEKLIGDEQRFSLVAAQPEPTIAASAADRAKPLTVTSSTFRAADNKPRKDLVQPQDGSRKDNTFPRPVHQPTEEKSFAGVQALKESLEESLKENDEPKRNQQCRQQSAASRAPFVFQVYM